MIQNITSKNTEKNTQNNQNEVKNFEAYGGFWRRTAAYILDMWPSFIAFIIFIIYMFILMLLNNELASKNDIDSFINLLLFPFIILVLIHLVNIGYNIYLYYIKKTTIGYEILGMRIISEKTGEKKYKWGMTRKWIMEAVISIILYFVIVWILIIWTVIPDIRIIEIVLKIIFYIETLLFLIIGFMIILSKKKQGPHDRIAGTLVVMEKTKRKWIVWIINLLFLISVILFIWIVGTIAFVFIAY